MKRTSKRRENTESALKSVDRVFDDNLDIVRSVPALDEDVKEFKVDFAVFESDEAAYESAMEGKTNAKHDAEEALIESLHPVSCALRSYSRKAKKPEIFALVNVEEYELGKMRDTDLLAHAKAVLKKATENAAGLVAYNVTPEELAGLQSKIDAYDSALKGQGGSMASQSGEYEALKVSLRKVEDDLIDIDDVMGRVKRDSRKFYDAYVSARHVKALGTRHNKPPDTPPQNPPNPGK